MPAPKLEQQTRRRWDLTVLAAALIMIATIIGALLWIAYQQQRENDREMQVDLICFRQEEVIHTLALLATDHPEGDRLLVRINTIAKQPCALH
jgi:hypothetical protein